MASTRTTIFIHIGLERTGTTSLQRYCTTNAAALARRNVLYPTRGPAFSRLNHAPLAAAYLPAERATDPHLRSLWPRERMVARLRAEIDAAETPAVLISAEHLSSRWRAPQIQALAEDLAGYDCRLVVAVREHFARLLSSYAVHVMSGSAQTLDDYAAMVCWPDNIYLRYAETLALWEAAFGRAAMSVIEHTDGCDMIDLVLRQVGVERIEAHPQRYALNGSLDPASLDVVRLVNAALQSGRADGCERAHVEFRRQDYVRSIIRRHVRATPESPRPCASRSWRLSAENRAAVRAIADRDRGLLAYAHGLRLAPSAEPAEGGEGATASSDSAVLLARILTQVVAGQGLAPTVLASRSIGFSLLDQIRRIAAR